jgi:hypothetical protein
MDRYIGLDAHSSSCTVAVIGPSGRRLQSQVLETNAKVLIDFLKTIPGTLHLCLEEGTHSHWLPRWLPGGRFRRFRSDLRPSARHDLFL